MNVLSYPRGMTQSDNTRKRTKSSSKTVTATHRDDFLHIATKMKDIASYRAIIAGKATSDRSNVVLQKSSLQPCHLNSSSFLMILATHILLGVFEQLLAVSCEKFAKQNFLSAGREICQLLQRFSTVRHHSERTASPSTSATVSTAQKASRRRPLFGIGATLRPVRFCR